MHTRFLSCILLLLVALFVALSASATDLSATCSITPTASKAATLSRPLALRETVPVSITGAANAAFPAGADYSLVLIYSDTVVAQCVLTNTAGTLTGSLSLNTTQAIAAFTAASNPAKLTCRLVLWDSTNARAWINTTTDVQYNPYTAGMATPTDAGTVAYATQAWVALLYAPLARTITAGTGISGGGDLSSNRTLALANTAVTPGSYTLASLTVDAQGRLTAASSGSATEADTLATTTARGATTAQAVTLTGASALALGSDVAGGTTNVPGWLKLWSNGDNAYSTVIQAGTQSGDVTYTLPVDDGTASQVLTTDGSGVLSWTTPAGAPEMFGQSSNDARIVQDAAGDTFTAGVGAAGQVTLSGAYSGRDAAFGTDTDGANNSGTTMTLFRDVTNGTDSGAYLEAMSGTRASPGTSVFRVGSNGSIAANGGTASASGAVALGPYNTASGIDSVAMGLGSVAVNRGEWSHAGNAINTVGDSQTSLFEVQNSTTGTTPTALLLWNVAYIPIQANYTWHFTVNISASNLTDDLGAAYTIRGCIRRGGTSNTRIIGTNVTEVWEEGAMSGCDGTVTADDTNDGMVVTVTGLEGKTIDWHATVIISMAR